MKSDEQRIAELEEQFASAIREIDRLKAVVGVGGLADAEDRLLILEQNARLSRDFENEFREKNSFTLIGEARSIDVKRKTDGTTQIKNIDRVMHRFRPFVNGSEPARVYFTEGSWFWENSGAITETKIAVDAEGFAYVDFATAGERKVIATLNRYAVTLSLSEVAAATALTTDQIVIARVLVEEVTAGVFAVGQIRRSKLSDHYDGKGKQKNHSFLPTQTGETTANITPGYVKYGEHQAELYSPGPIDFSSDSCFWIVLDYSSASGPVLDANLASGAAFPDYYDAASRKMNIPVVKFVGNVFSGMIRHLTNDLLLDAQGDHSFLPKRLTSATASITPGYVVYGAEDKVLVSPANITFSADSCFWLVLDYSSVEPVTIGPNLTGGAAFPVFHDIDNKKINVPIVSFSGNDFESMVRHQTNDIILPEVLSDEENSTMSAHSFLPVQATDTTCSFLAGHVVMRNGTTLSVSPSNIDFSVNKYFWLVLDYSSASYSISNTLGAAADEFPVYADWANKRLNIPLVSFVNNTFASLKRYQTNDVIIPQAVDTDSGGGLKTIERSPSTDAGRDSAQIRNAVNSKDYQVPYLVPQATFKEAEWRWPVKGPGATAESPGALTSQAVTALTSASGSANATVTLVVKTRTHTVAEGAEVWGTESSETNVVGQVLWTGGTLYQVWQVTAGGYGWDWVRAHG